MSDYNTPGRGIGDNSGDEPLDEQAKRAIDIALAQHRPRLDQLLASAERAAITDADSAGKVTDLLAMFSTLEGKVSLAHTTAKEPYLTAGRVVDGVAAGFKDEMIGARRKLGAMLTAWQSAEQKRVDELRAAERAAEAADPEPTATDHDEIDQRKVRTRGDFGSSASLTDVLVIEMVDVKRLPKAFLERPAILAVIEAEAKKMIRAGTKVTGVTSRIEKKSRVRRGG